MATGSTVHTILQCFVDLNLETDENAIYSLDLLDVSFNRGSIYVKEGQIVELEVRLSTPSVNGYEEVDVDIVYQTATPPDINLLGETYPKTLTFSAGQQTHTLRFLANSDFIEEGQFNTASETFDLIIGTFINVNPGNFITSTVYIIDLTDLKEVFINPQGGNYQISNITSANTLTFSTTEGLSKEFMVSLDNPSIFGVEGVTVNFTNATTSSNDYSIIGSSNLTWAIGEQDKFFTAQTTDDGVIEGTETLQIGLSNPINANIVTSNSPLYPLPVNKAEFKIFDNSPESRFINVNFQELYTQIGGFNNQNITNLRHANNNQELSTSSSDETMLLKFGDSVNTKISTTYTGPASVCGSNCIRASITNQFNVVTGYDDKIFFGQNPNTSAYGDVRLKTVNRGQYAVVIDGNQINPGQSVTLDIDAFDYNVTLPANDTLLSGGTILAGETLLVDTLSEAQYEFIIETDYAERTFSLKDFNNFPTTSKSINIGNHIFKETYSLSGATGSTNQHNLVTTYNQVLANWDNYPNYNSPKTCVPLNAYINNNWNFPSNPPDAISVTNGSGHARINGFAVLSDNNINYLNNGVGDGPTPSEESRYVSTEFLPSGKTIGVTCAPIVYPGTQTEIAWTSLAFERIL